MEISFTRSSDIFAGLASMLRVRDANLFALVQLTRTLPPSPLVGIDESVSN